MKWLRCAIQMGIVALSVVLFVGCDSGDDEGARKPAEPNQVNPGDSEYDTKPVRPGAPERDEPSDEPRLRLEQGQRT